MTVIVVLVLILAVTGNAFAQETGSNNGVGGGDIILFDLVNTAVHAEQDGIGSTCSVWHGSDLFDDTASEKIASEESEGATEGREVFERVKPHVYVSSSL